MSSVFLAIFPVLAVGDVSVGVMMLAGLLITVMTLFIMVIVTINTYILILIREYKRKRYYFYGTHIAAIPYLFTVTINSYLNMIWTP